MQKKLFCLFCASAVLLGFFFFQFPASALEVDEDPKDSGVSFLLDDESEPEKEPSDSENIEPFPAEENIDLWEEKAPSTTPNMADIDLSSVSADVSAIRQNSDIFLYFVIPVSCAFFLIFKFCVWFYSIFVKDAL